MSWVEGRSRELESFRTWIKGGDQQSYVLLPNQGASKIKL